MTYSRHEAALRSGRFLHVISYYSTPAAQARRLERELSAHLAYFDPVLPEHLDAYFTTGHWPLRRAGFIAAFYDGYRDHATVAAPICERLGMTGWFLPPTGFLDCPAAEQEEYRRRHALRAPGAPNQDGRLALTWEELAAIGRRHVLAAHTAGHVGPSSVATADDAERELVEPRRRLAECSGTIPSVLAWSGSSPDAGGFAAGAARAAGYRYVISATKIQRIAR